MKSGCRFILFVLALCSVPSCFAQAVSADTLWSIWCDTANLSRGRIAALARLMSEQSTLTPEEAVHHCGSTGPSEPMSSAYLLELARARSAQGWLLVQQGHNERALAPLDSSMAAALLHGDQALYAFDLSAVANALTYLGRGPEAIMYQIRASRALEALGDTVSWANSIGNTAYIFSLQKDQRQAIRYAHEALDLVRVRYPAMQYNLLMALFSYATTANEWEEAARYLEEARGLVERGTVIDDRADIPYNDARLALHHGECERGLKEAERCMAFMGNAAPDFRSSVLALLAQAHLCAGRYDRAILSATEGLAIAEEHALPSAAIECMDVLAVAYEAAGAPAKALHFLRRKILWDDSLYSGLATASVSSALLTSEFEKEQITDSLKRVEEQYRLELEHQATLGNERERRNLFIGLAGMVLLVAGGLAYRLRFTRKAKAAIEAEHARSESLLLNILPHEVADELKAKGEAEAKHFDRVTILFSDFKGFTQLSERVTPRQLVHDLHECFSAFDRICEKHGIEKIKTIGDAYMAAGGLPTPNTTHPTDVIRAALEMRDFIAEGKARKVAAGLPYFEIRIGIHTGPVVAGIVGVKKFQYDIWGDTVNTASRMESSGEVGQVNISEATYRLVNGEERLANGTNPEAGIPRPPFTNSHSPAFVFTPRGKVQAKGKGEMEMYFVT